MESDPSVALALDSLLRLSAAAAIGLLIAALVVFLLGRVAARTSSVLDEKLIGRCRLPLYFIVPLFALLLVLPGVGLSSETLELVRRLVVVALTLGIGWALITGVRGIGDYVVTVHSIDHADNLDERQIQTQVQLLSRVVIIIIVIITGAAVLMTIPSIRSIGVSIFASAGLAGIVIGLAARPTIGNIVAGVQIALSQPIRIDDVVIVEGEWGWIEEMHTTYVVVRIWDQRRLIVPLSYFIETPFQNWTRKSADILGTVFLYTDYTVPVEEIRQETIRLTKASELWDGRVCELVVTDTTMEGVELRILISASSSPRAWDLRCHLREKLVEFIQQNYPGALPRTRAELVSAPEAPSVSEPEA